MITWLVHGSPFMIGWEPSHPALTRRKADSTFPIRAQVVLKSPGCLHYKSSSYNLSRRFQPYGTPFAQHWLSSWHTFSRLRFMAVAESPQGEAKDCVDVSGTSATEKSGKVPRHDSPKSDPGRSVRSERSDNATVAMYDVKNNQFRTIKRREVESAYNSVPADDYKAETALELATMTQDLPRWSNKTKVFVPEPKDEKRHYYLATLNLGKLGLQYNLRRHLCATRELYIIFAWHRFNIDTTSLEDGPLG